MKKNRASFFNESTDFTQYNSNVFSQNIPNQGNMYPVNGQIPAMPAVSAQSNFYAGPSNIQPQMNIPNQYPQQVPMQNGNIPGNMPMQNTINITQTEDLDSRLAKIERQINRLEHRVNTLEQNSSIISDNFDSNINDMYMV